MAIFGKYEDKDFFLLVCSRDIAKSDLLSQLVIEPSSKRKSNVIDFRNSFHGKYKYHEYSGSIYVCLRFLVEIYYYYVTFRNLGLSQLCFILLIFERGAERWSSFA